MIKKLLFSTVLLFTLSTSIAQPTLTRAANSPASGDNFNINFYNLTWDPGAAGANATWDFSGLGSDQTTAISFETPTGVMSSMFPASNVAMVPGDDYFQINDNGWERVGVNVQGVVFNYSNTEKVIGYPFNYNSSYSDSFVATYNLSIYEVTRKGKMECIADGYGTLKMPGKTYSNVLRVKYVETATDYYNGGMILFTNTTTLYHYYAPSVHYPVLILNKLVPSMGSQRSYATYIDNTTGIETNGIAQNTYIVSPNPASDYLSVEFNNVANSNDGRITISDVLGQVVEEIDLGLIGQGVFQKQISLNGLNHGFYFVTTNVGGYKLTKKIMIK